MLDTASMTTSTNTNTSTGTSTSTSTSTTANVISEGMKQIFNDMTIQMKIQIQRQCEQVSQDIAARLEAQYAKRHNEQSTIIIQSLRNQVSHLTSHLHDTERKWMDCQERLGRLLDDRVHELRQRNILRVPVPGGRGGGLGSGGQGGGGGGGTTTRMHVITKWRHFVQRRKKARWMLYISRTRHDTKLKYRYFLKWIKYHTETKRDEMEQKYEMKLNTIAKQIVHRYEGELKKLRSDLANSLDARKKMETHMRHTLLQGMSAMSIETMALFNEENNDHHHRHRHHQSTISMANDMSPPPPSGG